MLMIGYQKTPEIAIKTTSLLPSVLKGERCRGCKKGYQIYYAANLFSKYFPALLYLTFLQFGRIMQNE